MSDIMKKMKNALTEEDQKILEETIEALVEEKASKQASLLVEEEKVRLEKASKEYVDKVILEETEKLQNKLNEEYEQKYNTLEENYVEKINDFLEHEISENISDEALEKIAINETFKPIVEGVKQLFAEHGLELDSEGSALLKEARDEIVELKADVSRLMEENLDLNKKLEKMAIRDIINLKCEGMIPEQRERVQNMFEGKSFEDVESKIDEFVEIVLEGHKAPEGTELHEGTDLEKEGDKIITEETEKKTEKGSAIDSVNNILKLFN